MNVTQQQWTLLKAFGVAVAPSLATFAVNKLHLAPDDVQTYFQLASAAFVLIGGWWGLSAATAAAQVLNVKAIPEVATVVVKDSAVGPVKQLAVDPSQPDVVTETQNEIDAKQGTKV